MRTFNVERLHGAASFVDPNTVRVGPEKLLRGEKILIATGSSPVRPAEFPFEHPRVHDSDEILEIGALPKTLAVVGAGVIGAEYACTFAALGVAVHLTTLTSTALQLGIFCLRPASSRHSRQRFTMVRESCSQRGAPCGSLAAGRFFFAAAQ